MSESTLTAANLRMIAQLADTGRLSEFLAVAQALIEGQPFGQSSRDEKLVMVDPYTGLRVPASHLEYCGTINGVRLKRHKLGGGLVPVEQDPDNRDGRGYVSLECHVDPTSIITGGYLVRGVFRHCMISGGEFNHGTYENVVASDGIWMQGERYEGDPADTYFR